MKLNRKTSMWLTGLVLVLTACSQPEPASGLRFEEAWVRDMPPGMKMTAGFGTLRNTESADIVIASWSSLSFGDVSLHRTEMVDGVSRMRAVSRLTVPSGGAVELAPGGYHLMLMMPGGEIHAGQAVQIGMTAADGRSFVFELPVERR